MTSTSNPFYIPTIPIYNDNTSSTKQAHNMTEKGLRYIQICENVVREAIINGIITLQHIEGTVNITNLFTKEYKNTAHFISICDILI